MLQRKFALIKRKLDSYSVDDLTDVAIGTPTNGDVLVWSGGTQFVPGDHGDIGGLSDDDHPQYAQIAATETISAVWTFNAVPVFSAGATFSGGTVDVSSATISGLSSDDLSDVASIGMLDENETVTGTWSFGTVTIDEAAGNPTLYMKTYTGYTGDIQLLYNGTLEALIRWEPTTNVLDFYDRNPSPVVTVSLDMDTGDLQCDGYIEATGEQKDAIRAGYSASPSMAFGTSSDVDSGITVQSVTAGDQVGFYAYMADGSRNWRCFFGMHDNDAWGMNLTGSSVAASTPFKVTTVGNSMIEADYQGATRLYYNNANKLQTDSAGITLPKTSGYGIKVDSAAPTFGWRDIIGSPQEPTQGSGKPSWVQIASSGVYCWSFATSDTQTYMFHMPHDYVPGTDIHFHVHWFGSQTAGNSTRWQFDYLYAQGHQQAAFPTTATTVYAQQVQDTTAYTHMIAETSGVTIANLEPDGVVIVQATRIAPTGGPSDVSGSVYVPMIDIHYQSTNMATKQKAPDFYT